MTRHATVILTAALLAAPPVALAAFQDATGFRLEAADSDATSTVIITVPVNLQRMIQPPLLRCEIRGNSNYGNDTGRYGLWNEKIALDSGGNVSTTLTARIRIRYASSNELLKSQDPVYVQCRIFPPPPPSQNPEYFTTTKPPADSENHRALQASPAPVLQVSGQAQ